MCGQGKKASASFLKKRSKKLLSIWFSSAGNLTHTRAPKGIKVFWFFFSKKNRLLAS
jgi:hypothetical protein